MKIHESTGGAAHPVIADLEQIMILAKLLHEKIALTEIDHTEATEFNPQRENAKMVRDLAQKIVDFYEPPGG